MQNPQKPMGDGRGHDDAPPGGEARPAPLILTDRVAADAVPGAGAESAPQSDARPVPGKAAQRRARRRAARARRAERTRRGRGGAWFLVTLICLALGVGIVTLGLTGKPIRLPVWVVADAEARLNRTLADALGAGGARGTALSIGGAVLVIDRSDWSPRLSVEDLRILRPGGEVFVTVPEMRIAFDPLALMSGQVRVQSLRLIGPRATLRRLPDGRFDLALGGGLPEFRVDTLPALFAAANRAFERPALASLIQIEAEALSVTLQDDRAGRRFELGDGRLTVQNRPEGVAAEVGLSLAGAGPAQARATVTAVTERADGAARVTVTVDGVAAADIAAQAPALAWLRLVEGAVSGQFASAFSADGVRNLSAQLVLGPGALRPAPGAAPVAFERVALAFDHDPARDRIDLREVAIDSASLRLQASGHVYVQGLSTGRVPDTAVAQIAVQTLRIDPDGVFEAPAEFTGGALDLRLRLDPFTVDIGQATLLDGNRRMTAKGRVSAGDAGWRIGVDLGLDAIGRDRLLALWPVQLVPLTRDWLDANLQQATLFDVRAALRLAPEHAPRLSLTYEFAGAGLRVIRTLPPIEGAYGYATVEGNRYTLVADRGQIVAPEGGTLDVAGSVLVVPDITKIPATGEIDLRSEGPLTATLSILDQPPFRYLSRAGQPVDLGEGTARMRGQVTMPLVERAPPGSVVWKARGVVRDFRSTRLVAGRTMEVPALRITGDMAGLSIGGVGTLDGVPFDATFRQPFGPGATGARVEGTVELSQATSDRLRLGLPAGTVRGTGQGKVDIALAKGAPPALTLTSDLAGVGLSIPQLGWSKPEAGTGALTVEATLAEPARVDRLALDAAGLVAEGTVTLRPGGALDVARFGTLRVGGWLDAAVELSGQGGGPPAVALTGGSIDVRRLPGGQGGAGSGGTALPFRLDSVRISDGIAVTGVTGRLDPGQGLAGAFIGRVNGQAPIEGRLAPAPFGTAVRVTSAEAGAVLSAAGIFPNARGGSLDMTLTPREGGGYAGRATLADFRVRNTPVIAELLNAISVVGLLEQVNGGGLLFSSAEADFRIGANAIEMTRASAVGASMGVSLAGLYDMGTRRLDMQGVISPVYLVNGIGAVFTRKGEGLFGFNYRLRGTAEAPEVSVNPLSILTPGMFRELFRAPPPRIPRAAGEAPPEPVAPRPPARRGEDR